MTVKAKKISELKRSLEEDIPPTQFVGGIFPRKHVSVISSEPGTGKTWFILKYALDGTLGGSIFLGLAHHQAPFKSLIMCGEGGLEMLIERKQLLNADYNPDKIAIYTMQDLVNNDIEICLDTKDGITNLRKIVKGEAPDIVFIDTLISFRADDENASKETSRLLRKLQGIAQENNCAIVISHHLRKKKRGDDGESNQNDIIGSSAITRLCGTAFIMEHQATNAYTKLQCVKTWWNKPAPIYWKIETGKTVKLVKASIGDDMTQNRLIVQEYLSSMTPDEVISIDQLIETTGARYEDVMCAIRTEQEAGNVMIFKTPKQGKIRITRNIKRTLPDENTL